MPSYAIFFVLFFYTKNVAAHVIVENGPSSSMMHQHRPHQMHQHLQSQQQQQQDDDVTASTGGQLRIRNIEDLIRQLEQHSTRHMSPNGSEDIRMSETEADRHYRLDSSACSESSQGLVSSNLFCFYWNNLSLLEL